MYNYSCLNIEKQKYTFEASKEKKMIPPLAGQLGDS